MLIQQAFCLLNHLLYPKHLTTILCYPLEYPSFPVLTAQCNHISACSLASKRGLTVEPRLCAHYHGYRVPSSGLWDLGLYSRCSPKGLSFFLFLSGLLVLFVLNLRLGRLPSVPPSISESSTTLPAAAHYTASPILP